MEMVVMEKVSGEDNGIMVSAENPAIMQEPIKRIKKKVIYRSNIIKFNYLGWLLCKVKTIDKINSEVFLVKLGPLFKTNFKNPSSEFNFKII